MNMIKKMKWVSVLILGCVYSLFGFAATTPLPMVQDINHNVIATLKKHQSELKTHPQYIQQAIHTYFIPHVDTLGMSRSVLGRNVWKTASASDKEAFKQEFTNLVLRTYAQPLANFSGETVEFLPVKSSSTPKFAQVQTIIVRPNGQRIPMTYHLVLINQNDWKIYDLSVDGVSLLNSFRNQFGDALKQDSLKSVIHELHEKNKKLVS